MRLCVACAALLVHLFVSALIPTTWSGEPATKLLLAHGAINSNRVIVWPTTMIQRSFLQE